MLFRSDPLETESLIQETQIMAVGRELWTGWEAKYVCPIVDCDHDDVLVGGKPAAIVGRLTSVAELETASVYPEHDCLGRCISRLRAGVHIQVQAVLALRGIV